MIVRFPDRIVFLLKDSERELIILAVIFCNGKKTTKMAKVRRNQLKTKTNNDFKSKILPEWQFCFVDTLSQNQVI